MAPKAIQTGRKRGVSTIGVLFDEELTKAALRLTDPTVQTQPQVIEIFRKLARGRQPVLVDHDLNRGRNDETDTFDTYDWEEARDWLLRLLPKISQFDRLSKSSRSALLTEINKAAPVAGQVDIRITSAGLSIATDMGESLTDVAFRAVLPFLEPNYGWPPQRLAKCQLHTCSQWFLRRNQSGTVAMYCSAKHSSLARVRRARGTKGQMVTGGNQR